MQLKRVVIAVDFSEPSAAAAVWTTSHFAHGAEVILVHVLSDRSSSHGNSRPDRRTLAMKECCALREKLPAGYVGFEVVQGHAAAEILRIASERDADLIAIGRRGGGTRPKLLGSIAQELILRAAIPVLVCTGMEDEKPQNILAAVHDDASRKQVVAWARWLSERFDAGCVAASVVGETVRTHLLSMASLAARGGGVASHELKTGEAEPVEEWATELTSAGTPFEPQEAERHSVDPAKEIVAAATRLHSDLIVVGSHDPGLHAVSPARSVGCKIARQAHCAVLVVKPAEGGARELV